MPRLTSVLKSPALRGLVPEAKAAVELATNANNVAEINILLIGLYLSIQTKPRFLALETFADKIVSTGNLASTEE